LEVLKKYAQVLLEIGILPELRFMFRSQRIDKQFMERDTEEERPELWQELRVYLEK
jgi:hypothetical protein